MQEETVTEFEIAEDGLSAVLTNAIEDQRALVDHLTARHDELQRAWVKNNSAGHDWFANELKPKVSEAAEMQFRAMRVLGLLEATREREAGQVA